jgi:hypothetical protein
MSQNYKTATGKILNMDRLRLLHEKEIAVGNTNLNARGDSVLKNGQIIKSRSDRLKEYYDRKK